MNRPLRGSINVPGVVHGDVTLFIEPADDISRLGAMVAETQTALELLKKLPFAGDGYRGELRVVLGIAERTRNRCLRLLGEDEPDEPDSVPKPPATRRPRSR